MCTPVYVHVRCSELYTWFSYKCPLIMIFSTLYSINYRVLFKLLFTLPFHIVAWPTKSNSIK